MNNHHDNIYRHTKAPSDAMCNTCQWRRGTNDQWKVVCEDCYGTVRRPIPFFDIAHHYVEHLMPHMRKDPEKR